MFTDKELAQFAARRCAEKDVEIARLEQRVRLGDVARDGRNAEVSKQLAAANALIAIQDNAMKRAREELHACQAVISLAGGFDVAYVNGAQASMKEIDSARTATAEAVAAWEAAKIEPLRSEVAALNSVLRNLCETDFPYRDWQKARDVVSSTKSTAEANDREVAAKALEDASESAPDDASEIYCRTRAAELRATKGE